MDSDCTKGLYLEKDSKWEKMRNVAGNRDTVLQELVKWKSENHELIRVVTWTNSCSISVFERNTYLRSGGSLGDVVCSSLDEVVAHQAMYGTLGDAVAGQCWIKLNAVRTVLNRADCCLRCYDSIWLLSGRELSWMLLRTTLSQANCCPGQRLVKLNTVRDRAK